MTAKHALYFIGRHFFLEPLGFGDGTRRERRGRVVKGGENINYVSVMNETEDTLATTNEDLMIRILFALLFLVLISYELLSFRLISITASFYSSIAQTPPNKQLFFSTLVSATFVIIAISLIKACKTFVTDHLALQWRLRLVKCLHHSIFTNESSYSQFKSHPNKSFDIDNVDQRICQDAEKLTSLLAKVVSSLLLLPFVILYYTYYLWSKLGWIPPVACFGYFFIGSFLCWTTARTIPILIYNVEKMEGNFRFIHSKYRVYFPSIHLLNGYGFELMIANESFEKIVHTTKELIIQTFYLNLASNLFDYAGSIGKALIFNFCYLVELSVT